jgi:hypothetical protein
VPFTSSPSGPEEIIGPFVYNRDEVERCMALAERGAITPLVHKVLPRRRARDGHERREHFGKIVPHTLGGTR